MNELLVLVSACMSVCVCVCCDSFSRCPSCYQLQNSSKSNKVVSSLRIMVMDAGLIKEFAPPEQLLANKNSAFYGMARDAGLV